jgi:hypothetical protein
MVNTYEVLKKMLRTFDGITTGVAVGLIKSHVGEGCPVGTDPVMSECRVSIDGKRFVVRVTTEV